MVVLSSSTEMLRNTDHSPGVVSMNPFLIDTPLLLRSATTVGIEDTRVHGPSDVRFRQACVRSFSRAFQ
jgi:hypothetical protein